MSSPATAFSCIPEQELDVLQSIEQACRRYHGGHDVPGRERDCVICAALERLDQLRATEKEA